MEKTLDDLARIVGGRVVGESKTVITGISGIREAQRGDITFVANRKYAHLLVDCRASAVVLGENVPDPAIPAIKVKNPDLAFAQIVDAFAPPPVRFEEGIHPAAIVGKDVTIGKGVSIQAYAVVQDGAEIGEGTVIYPFVYLGHFARVGHNTIVYPNVVIRERCTVGNNCIIHSGTVIGSDGFGFSTVSGVHYKIPQIGIVQIDDDVEIGSNVAIDRARFGKTHIARGTKIDNLVQVAHNVQVGENTFIVAQAGIAGSARIGNNVILAGQSGVDGHRTIGDNVVVAAKSGVTKDIPPNKYIMGFPAQEHAAELKLQATLRKLPQLVDQVKALEERLREIEKKSADAGQER